jgi:hypothetical protein
VVILGPDDLFREAARIVPRADGSWSATGLAPGRYRVQLDGGPDRVLATRPAFVTLDVSADGAAIAPEIAVLRAY